MKTSSPQFRAAVVMLALIMSLGSQARAQNATGAISGTATDPSSSVIANAAVTATNTATGVSRKMTTGSAGNFRFDNLQPGEYVIKAEAQGFASQTQTVTVQVATTLSINFSMTVGQVAEVVEVTGAAALVSTTESKVSTTYNRDQVDALPMNGRSFLSVATLDPGTTVVYNPGTSTLIPPFNAYTRIAIAGALGSEQNASQTNIQVDGIRVNDRYTGNASQNFSADTVQEFQLSTSNFDLSSGTSASGSVNIVSRTGTNVYHGTGFLFFRDHNLAAYPVLKRNSFNPDPYFARKQYGFTLSGPIKKDKLLFFVNYERTDQMGAQTVQFTDPLVASFSHVGKLPLKGDLFGSRLDYTINSNNNLFFRFNVDKNHAVIGTTALESTWVASDNFASQGVLGVTSVLKPTLVNDFRFGYSYFREWMAGPTQAECESYAGNPAFCVGIGGARINFFGGLYIGNDFSIPQDRHQRTVQFTDNVNWTRGTHSLRFGGDWEHYNNNGTLNFYAAGTFSAYSPTQLQGLNQALYATLPASLRSVTPGGPTIPELMQLPMSGALSMGIGDPTWPGPYLEDKLRPNDLMRFYIQDTWQARPKFTVNYGIAWSMENNIIFHELDRPAYLAPLGIKLGKIPQDLNNFDPALGFAWSPGKDNKTVFRVATSIHNASQGRTLDRNTDELNISPAGSGRRNATSTALANPKAGQPGQPATLSFVAPAAFTIQDMANYLPTARGLLTTLVNGNYNGKDLSIRNIEVLKTGFVFDSDFKTPYTFQVNAGVQREVFRNLSVSVDYVMIRGVHFGAMDVFQVDRNRYGRFSNYTIDPTTGAANAAAFRNPVLPACTTAQALDPKAQCSTGAITYGLPGMVSRYNALQIKVDRRFSKGIQFTGTYATAKSTSFQGIQNYDNYAYGYGVNPTTPKHRMTASAIWDVTKYKGDNKAARTILNGWQLSGIMQMQTSLPISVMMGALDPEGDGTTTFRLPGLPVSGFGWNMNADDVRKLVADYNAKYPAPANVALKDIPRSQRDSQGVAYPYVVLPDRFANNDSFVTHDLRLTRTITLHERAKLQLVVEGFNIFNVANLTGYSGTVDAYVRPAVTGGTPTLPVSGLLLGQPQSRVNSIFGTGGPRAFQIAARFTF
jgi:hypothetical protein